MKKILINLYKKIILLTAVIFFSSTINAVNKIDISGLLSFDQTLFFGADNTKDYYLSGVKIKNASINVSGVVDNILCYNLSLKMGDDTIIRINDASVTYTKLEKDRINISIGQIGAAFGLENTSGNAWSAFLNKSISSTFFNTPQGIGLSFNKWSNNYSINIAIKQPKQGEKPKENSNENDSAVLKQVDKWSASTRIAYRPVCNKKQIIQLGVSFYHEQNGGAWLRFKTIPEADARHTVAILDTNGLDKNRSIEARYHSIIATDLSLQHGPFKSEFEYHRMYVAQAEGTNISYMQGLQWQATYVVTGENKLFNIKNGTWKNLPVSENSIEIGIRYSYLNAENEDIQGGIGHNATIGVNWYINPNVKVSANYIKSFQNADFEKIKLDIIALRFQFKF